MMDRLDAAVLAMNDGLLGPAPWAAFVRETRKAFGANYANMIFRRPDFPVALNRKIEDFAQASDWVDRSYKDVFSCLDPIPYFRMNPGKVYAYEELTDIADESTGIFHRDFLGRAGFDHLLILRVQEPGGLNAWVTITRAEADGAFMAEDRTLLERLAHHVSGALANYAAFERLGQNRQVYERALNMLSFGVMTLDASGTVLSCDDAARLCIEQSDELSILGGRLRTLHADPALRAAIREAVATEQASWCHLGSHGGDDLLVVPNPQAAGQSANDPRLTVYISNRSRFFRDFSGQLGRLFDLPPRQAQLATLLAHGKTLSEAAGEIGITEHTARTYAKEIFQRTGTNRQGELIQKILTSVAVLA